MKSYSNNTVTSTDLEIVKREAGAQAALMMEAVDIKQGKQIAALRIAVGVSFLVNVLLTLGLKFIA